MRRLNHPVYRNRVLQVCADGALVALAFYLAFRLRFLDQSGLPHRYWLLFAQSVGFVVVGKLIVFGAFGLYQKWWRYVSGRDFLLIVRAVAVSSAILVVAYTVLRPFAHNLPRSVAVMDFLLTLMLIAGARLAVRLIVERPSRGGRVPRHEVLVIGAGSGGQMVVRELALNPDLGATAIGFVDDDPRKRGMRMSGGLKVLGSTKQIDRILDETHPDEVVIAIPSAPGTLRAKVVAACREREIRVRTLPTVFELLRGGVQLNKQLREVQVTDVLGRDPIVVELDRVGAYLRDRIVLVTGAGGSIGSELCRQIARVGPRLLVMLDHAEDNLFEIDREMVEERHFSNVESVLADCKEPGRMLETMQRFKPSVVFHAAAYKHVPLMEANPLEAVQLVIRAGDIGAGKGEVFVLDMGEPVRIVDLAHNMIRLAGYEPEADIAIEFTKPRPGEKLHEELFGLAESGQPTAAKRIQRAVRETPLDPEWVEATLNSLEHLVLAGDEANLAQRVVEMLTAPGGDAAAVVYDE
jgi:FlaA1/EpsC-like NDP-sugar epimerase